MIDLTKFNAIQSDSRLIKSGDIFVATRGTNVDGNLFIESAVANGATAVVYNDDFAVTKVDGVEYFAVKDTSLALGELAHEFYGSPSHNLTLVGVTGTNGKTTIATLLYKLFMSLGYKVGLLSTVCNYIDNEAIEATHTTPDPVTLNALLAQMVEKGCQYAFMEVSSHAVDQKRIAGLKFAGGIFTNLTRDHIDYHQTFEAYLKAKQKFFDALDKDAFALSNKDDKNGAIMLQNSKAKKYYYSLNSVADFKTKIIENSFQGLLLNMNGQEVLMPFVGKFNASNLSAVCGAASLLGFEWMEILTHLSKLSAVAGRFETIYSPQGYTAIVDYAHTPDALNNVISTINQVMDGQGQLIVVVGCGGNRDKGKRPMMAKEAVDGGDRVIITSDNPRKEDPMEIINDMLAGVDVVQRRKVLVQPDRREAIKMAVALAQPHDVILIAGKGHEDYQIIGTTKNHFDDREEVKNAMLV